MFSNINPYVCCNQDEFLDEIKFLREKTFPKLTERLIKLNINFDPVLIDYNESNDYVRTGHLVRLLLTSIKKCAPFFIGLMGHKYGPYLNKTQVTNFLSSDSSLRLDMNWLEKNYLIAAQTGFNHVINADSFNNSILDHQITQALSDSKSYPFYRFYFRQFEYFEDMYSHLPVDKRKQELKKHEAENDFCDFKIKDIKMRLAKKGLIIKYYKSLEQLNDLIYDDFIDLVRVFLSANSNFLKTRNLLKTETLIYNKLNQSIYTDSLKHLGKSIDNFLKPRQSFSVTFKLDQEIDFKNDTDNNFQMESFDIDLEDEKEDFVEILKLRHLNLSSSLTPAPTSKSKQIFVISGPRGKGKTTFMSILYQKFIITKRDDGQDPFYLFYFLEPEDFILNTLVSITSKLRAKYLKKDSNRNLDTELYDQKSIIEQFNAALLLGPAFIFIDGLSELDPNRTINITQWLPSRLDNSDCKFVFTLRNSSDFYKELSRRSDCSIQEINLFQSDLDYEKYFKKFLSSEMDTNVLYSKFLNFFNELKTSEHFRNPLFLSLIGQEIFTFDKEIFKNHPVHMSRMNSIAGSSIDGSLVEGHEIVTSRSSGSSLLNHSVNIMNSYIEEVSTLREIIQKILKRYLRKNNWTVNGTLSLENPGWIGDTLCLIGLSLNGVTKESILRILKKRGYDGNLRVTDLYWNIFRMQFGNFIQDSFNGVLVFSHAYFKEAVQALLLDGFSVKVDMKTEESTASFKKNISEKQKVIHSLLISDILEHRLTKSDFDMSSQIQSSNTQNADSISQNVLKLLHELIHHLYMTFDLRNLNKLLTCFKIIQIFEANRIRFINEWFDLCYLIKIVRTYEENRLSLIKNLAHGIPHYEFEITNNQIELKQFEKNEDFKIEVFSKTETEQDEYYNKDEEKITLSSIDNLVDHLVDVTSPEYGDSVILLLINRSLILNDLMRHLDDKVYQENYAFSLLNFVHNIVMQNYPLSDTEKLRYSYLLEQLAKMSIQINNIDHGLKYIIKCIEILEDLFEIFNVSNLDKKYKTKMQLLQISNRLSMLHSNMALLLLKMNNLNGAGILLTKANSYNSEQLTHIIKKLDKKFKFDKTIAKSEAFINEKNDIKNLVYRESLEDYVKNQKSNIKDVYHNTDDAGCYESKFYFLFISGLFEVQQMNFGVANRFFQQALDLSVKWYGGYHSNTSKIYHYFGCFFSLQDMEFYNPRRAELYLRKSLYIKEKERQSIILSQDLQKTASLLSNSSFFTSSRSSNESQLQLFQQSSEFNQTSQYKKLNTNDDQNTIAEILFDLGGLLSNFDSIISKKEAMECLRRSLDIKTLILGANHEDCQIIKTKLNEILSQIAKQQVAQQQSETNNLTRETMSILGYQRSSSSWKSQSVLQLKKSLTNLNNNQKNFRSSHSTNDTLDDWIRQNSVLETINKHRLTKRNESETESRDIQDVKSSSFMEKTKIEPIKRQKTFEIPRVQSFGISDRSRSMLKSRKQPNAISVDSNVEKYSLCGPNSNVKTLILKNEDLKLKIAKKIYYKSAWYDLPQGSNQNRFKRFIKLAPNDPIS